ncbi:MAG: hypothetical protein KF784_14900 [Fimbriimonadaceae bacterium]|nr:hypothetical protein [Fimbriimonadaceae bacterium]
MESARKPLQFKGQDYSAYWPAVLMSERAEAKCKEMEILYAGFIRSLTRTLTTTMEELRTQGSGEDKIRVAELVADDDVPAGIRLSYKLMEEGLLICDLWTPAQPQLYGVSSK